MNGFDNANLSDTDSRGKPVFFVGVAVLVVVVLAASMLPAADFQPPAAAAQGAVASVTAAFGDDCEQLVIRELAGAKREVLVAIYSITRRRISSALAQAAGRGVKVTVKYDAEQEALETMKKAVGYLSEHGVKCIPVRLTHEHAAMHHKFIVIDGLKVVTGSYNFTVPASTLNYENVVCVVSPETAGAFVREFEGIIDR